MVLTHAVVISFLFTCHLITPTDDPVSSIQNNGRKGPLYCLGVIILVHSVNFLVISRVQSTYEDTQRIVEFIQQRVKCRPTIGIICGSGLGGLAEAVENKEILINGDIPGFPVSTGKIA